MQLPHLLRQDVTGSGLTIGDVLGDIPLAGLSSEDDFVVTFNACTSPKEVAKATSLVAEPPLSMTIPAKIKSGTAIKMCFVIAPNDT